MLPKIALPLEESLVLEDHLNDLIFRYKNEKYSKIKGKHMPKQFDTPFGNFPKDYFSKVQKKPETEITGALQTNPMIISKEDIFSSKKRLASEPTSKKSPLKFPKIQGNKLICGAFQPRDITFSEFRKFLFDNLFFIIFFFF